ncbi:MAG TPA: hypothetical protein VLV89_00305 [Candidatus Acidoferrum sp.]|nr:hypothetical protein [Candidatus Acidoferrum sp.]
MAAALIMVFGVTFRSSEFSGALPSDKPKHLIIVLPEDYTGWVCVDFGVSGAPPLPREGDAAVIRFLKGEALRTSTKPDSIPTFPQIWIETNGQRRPVPDGTDMRRLVTGSNSDRSGERGCYFIGTVDEVDAAGEPPGFDHDSPEAQVVHAEERQALIAIYEATGGNHWTHKVGWLGASGTECKWHGVECHSPLDGQATVSSLELGQNNLTGVIPEEIAKLTNLKDLDIYGNHLSGRLPDSIVERWLADDLNVIAEAPRLTDISEIEYESESVSSLCGYERIMLRNDGTAELFNKKCRNASENDRTTFCEAKQGRILDDTFAKLGWLIEKNGYFDLDHDYSRSITDSEQETTRVTRKGKTFKVSNYAASGPFQFWTIKRAIEGVALSAYWQKTSTLSTCSGH